MERFYNEFKNLSPEQQELFKAVMELITKKGGKDNNINFKTRIKNPEAHSSLDLFSIWCGDIGQKDAQRYINFFSQDVMEKYVSEKGEGRKELERILSSMIQNMKERSLGDRALGRHNNE